MDIKVFDKTATHEIEQGGVKFTIRTLRLSDRLNILGGLASAYDDADFAKGETEVTVSMGKIDYEQLVQAVAKVVIKIEGYENNPVLDVLQGIQNPNDFFALAQAIAKLSNVEKETAAKSES